MPKSKRSTVVALTKTDKKTKEQKAELINKIQGHCDEYHYVWVFRVENMRNKCLQDVREYWKGSKLCLGRNGVMRKALGATEEEEHKPGTSKIANLLEGDVGLLFTNDEPSVVTEWFESFKVPDFARAGNEATQEYILPAGPIMINDAPAPHSMEPQFRKLGLSSRLVKGVPTLDAEHRICKKGQKLKADEAHLLKLFGVAMAMFHIVPTTCLDLHEGKIVHSDT